MAKKKQKISKPQRGKYLTSGRGWSLVATSGKARQFPATLLQTFNFGKTRLAIFSVPK